MEKLSTVLNLKKRVDLLSSESAARTGFGLDACFYAQRAG